LSCQLQCEFGYRLDADGCEECACRNPCHDVHCPLNHVCRLVKPNCADEELAVGCEALPKCELRGVGSLGVV
jgi:hypothetical protein